MFPQYEIDIFSLSLWKIFHLGDNLGYTAVNRGSPIIIISNLCLFNVGEKFVLHLLCLFSLHGEDVTRDLVLVVAASEVLLADDGLIEGPLEGDIPVRQGNWRGLTATADGV